MIVIVIISRSDVVEKNNVHHKKQLVVYDVRRNVADYSSAGEIFLLRCNSQEETVDKTICEDLANVNCGNNNILTSITTSTHGMSELEYLKHVC